MQTSLVWFYLFGLLLIVLFLLVPWAEIKKLLPFGLIGGLAVALLMQYFAVNVFQWWRFNYALINLANTPLGVTLSWVPPVIIFAYFWSIAVSNLGKLIYIFVFALGTTVVEYSFVLAGYREYLNWNIYLTLGLALIIHLLLGVYLQFFAEKIDAASS
ncbi:MAG: hypothetical protein ACQERJ_05905 [Bacillota bacterium]